MADVFRIVTLDSAGAATTVADLNDETNIGLIRDSLAISPSQRKTQFVDSSRRYGGGRAASETHDNGTVAASLLLSNATDTPDAAVAKWSLLISKLVEAQQDYFLAWKPDGASNTIYYEVRGPATWQAKYQWVTFAQNKSLIVDVSWAVSPLGRGTPVSISAISVTSSSPITTLPSYGGTAPALLDLEVSSVSSPSTAPAWAMVAWTDKPSTTTNRPFGKIDSAAATGLTNWTASTSAPAGLTDATALYDSAATSAKTYTADWTIAPGLLSRDAFSSGDVTVEVWARIYSNAGHVCKATISAISTDAFAPARYSSEHGATGKLLIGPTSGSAWRLYRLGTVQLYADSERDWKLHLNLSQTASVASTTIGLDNIVVVPAKQRALSPTGKVKDATYPYFISTTASVTKQLKSDLTGGIKTSSATYYHPDAGIGGQLMELPAGGADLCVRVSDMVPDDPSNTLTTSESSSFTLSITGKITPRYYLANG